MMSAIFNNPNFTQPQIIFYFLGAFAWCACYLLIIRKIIKEKWVEFPAFVIAANVAWEFLWGFVFELSFGGIFLTYLWRGGFLLDVVMLYFVFKYGKQQYKTEFIRKNYSFLVSATLVAFLALIYFFVDHGYDLAMGFNSGMILNIILSVGCVLLFYNHPDRKFSVWIGIMKFVASDIFLFIYLLYYRETQYFSITMLAICFIIDLYYIYAAAQRNKKLELAPA